ncbi:hypothetical protein IHE44_0014979 [Lamprotornis superbus]|uniref:GIPC GH2 domain-containing protein n=1 Tax=Lamprotornis superbus TaxID=245042 RepID=A0A835TU47_9PASS|nr:hypothetical protein IHE44_0014979 [Lamprotornis superbus]
MAATIVEAGRDKKNPDEFAVALDETLGDFAFPDEFVFDVWGAIGDISEQLEIRALTLSPFENKDIFAMNFRTQLAPSLQLLSMGKEGVKVSSYPQEQIFYKPVFSLFLAYSFCGRDQDFRITILNNGKAVTNSATDCNCQSDSRGKSQSKAQKAGANSKDLQELSDMGWSPSCTECDRMSWSEATLVLLIARDIQRKSEAQFEDVAQDGVSRKKPNSCSIQPSRKVMNKWLYLAENERPFAENGWRKVKFVTIIWDMLRSPSQSFCTTEIWKTDKSSQQGTSYFNSRSELQLPDSMSFKIFSWDPLISYISSEERMKPDKCLIQMTCSSLWQEAQKQEQLLPHLPGAVSRYQEAKNLTSLLIGMFRKQITIIHNCTSMEKWSKEHC